MSDLDYTSRNSAWVAHAEKIDKLEREARAGAEVSCKQDTACAGALLSTSHISPKIPKLTIIKGASLIKVSRGRDEEQEHKGGGKRGLATFSKNSRRRMMALISVTLRSSLPVFVTLTYPFSFPTDNKIYKRHLDNLFKRLERAWPGILAAIWKLEPQKREAPHFHLLIWGGDVEKLKKWIPENWYEIAGGGDIKHLCFHRGEYGNKHCVANPETINGVMSYVSKYMSKEILTNWKGVGRWWGTFNKDKLPIGETVEIPISKKNADDFIRYARRYAHKAIFKKVWNAEHNKKVVLFRHGKPVILKYKKMKSFPFPSLSIMCNADNFSKKLLQEVTQGER